MPCRHVSAREAACTGTYQTCTDVCRLVVTGTDAGVYALHGTSSAGLGPLCLKTPGADGIRSFTMTGYCLVRH